MVDLPPIVRLDRRCAAALMACLLVASAAQGDDRRCLKGVKESLIDPDSRLDWDFSNRTNGSVCSFNGVSCWNAHEDRVLALSLPNLDLSGPIPYDLQYCSTTSSLDLSGNRFSGPIPADLCTWLPYLVTLDFSGNQLSGSIPPDLSNCHFLNSLKLSGNRLSGPIPPSLAGLDHLHLLDLSGNQLSGGIPDHLAASFDASSFSGNPALCGRPLPSRCSPRSLSRSSLIIIVVAGFAGAATGVILAYAASRWCLSRL